MKTIHFSQFIEKNHSNLPAIILAHGEDHYQTIKVKEHYVSQKKQDSSTEIIRFDIVRNGADLDDLNIIDKEESIHL